MISPLKTRVPEARAGRDQAETNANRQLFQAQRSDEQPKVRKRKSKGSNSSQTPDLNLPAVDTMALVPIGLVADRVNQMAKQGDETGGHASEDMAKKQRRFSNQSHAGSAAAADSSPRQAQ